MKVRKDYFFIAIGVSLIVTAVHMVNTPVESACFFLTLPAVLLLIYTVRKWGLTDD